MVVVRTKAEFLQAVRCGVSKEDLRLELKTNIDGWNAPKDTVRQDAARETCRDVAQFANTEGGLLVVGVTEKAVNGLAVADEVVGVAEPSKMKAWIDTAIGNYLVPSRFGQVVEPIDVDGVHVVVVSIPPSRSLVALWDESSSHMLQYVHRTSTGKAYLNPDEVERHMMNGSRAAQIALSSAREQAKMNNVTVVGGVRRRSGAQVETFLPQSVQLGQVTEDWFLLNVAAEFSTHIQVVAIPFGLLREAWCGVDSRMNVMLDVHLVWDSNLGLILEPRENAGR